MTLASADVDDANYPVELADGLKDVGDEINEELYNTTVSAFEDRYTYQKTGGVGVTFDTVILESGTVLNLIDHVPLVDLENKLRSEN